jgi:hypothetical protein
MGGGTLLNAPTLAYLMEQCQSLNFLSLDYLEMDEDHCRLLGTYSRPGLEIVLECCTIASAGASALVEVLGRNQGPTKLIDCDIDNFVLADGLRGNSSLKILRPLFCNSGDVHGKFLAIAGAVKESKGLVELDLRHGYLVNDDMWGAICDSLKTHPTLEVLDLLASSEDDTTAPTVLKSRVQTLVDRMKVNMSIHTIHLDPRFSQHELFRRSVPPYLKTNWFRSRVHTIQQTRQIPYRAKVLGRALLSVRSDANCFWMLLSGNAEVAFSSTTTVGNDETERVVRERGTESFNRDGNGPLHDDQWTLVQNPHRAWKKRNGVIKDGLVEYKSVRLII